MVLLIIRHLFFAYDGLLFCQATKPENECLRQILLQYEHASGQQLNLDKTGIVD